MNRLSIRVRIWLLTLAEIIGIIGMLLVDDSATGDVAFFALAAAPLVLGLGYVLASRSWPTFARRVERG